MFVKFMDEAVSLEFFKYSRRCYRAHHSKVKSSTGESAGFKISKKFIENLSQLYYNDGKINITAKSCLVESLPPICNDNVL